MISARKVRLYDPGSYTLYCGLSWRPATYCDDDGSGDGSGGDEDDEDEDDDDATVVGVVIVFTEVHVSCFMQQQTTQRNQR